MLKVNSFTQKPSATQILAYIIVVMGICVFYICITPNMINSAANISLSVLYGISTIFLVIFGVCSSYIDPSDPIISQYHQAIKENKSFQNQNYAYCKTCQSYCDKSSKHCGQCNRCTFGFDHHCIWINNCIGKSNYKQFVLMTSLTVIQLSLFMIASIYISLQKQFSGYIVAMIFIWIYTAIALIMGVMAFGLLAFHIYFSFKGITTYQYILQKRNQQKHSKKKQQIRRQNEQIADQTNHNINQLSNYLSSKSHKKQIPQNFQMKSISKKIIPSNISQQQLAIDYDSILPHRQLNIEVKNSARVYPLNSNIANKSAQSRSFPYVANSSHSSSQQSNDKIDVNKSEV